MILPEIKKPFWLNVISDRSLRIVILEYLIQNQSGMYTALHKITISKPCCNR